jgi:acetoin utilization deacetylase AcuC-like enzyme
MSSGTVRIRRTRPKPNTSSYTHRSQVLPFPLIYTPAYDLNLGDHVFPSRKCALIQHRLLNEGLVAECDFIAPEPASDADLLLVHEEQWIRRLFDGSLSLAEALRLEIPISLRTLEAVRLMTGGTMLAARHAVMNKSVGFNLGGGFHHAFTDHGEGFCAVNDIAVAIRKLQQEKWIERAMVVDCDVHQGNGTAAIFHADDSVFTLSIHQRNNYPAVKPPSDFDVELDDNTCDSEYLARLNEALDHAFQRFTPDFILYVAGADPFMEDQLGGLLLTMSGLCARDRMVLDLPYPVAVVLAGGYAFRTEDTVTIHCNTVKAAIQSRSRRESAAGTPRA